MSRIRVEISYKDLVTVARSSYSSAQSLETWLIGKLKEAGMPVKGVLLFDGVERGVLDVWEQLDTQCRIYEWSDDVSI